VLHFTFERARAGGQYSGVVQKVTFLGNTDNVNFGWFADDSTDGHPKKCCQILNNAGTGMFA
jgi:hypothetical protein